MDDIESTATSWRWILRRAGYNAMESSREEDECGGVGWGGVARKDGRTGWSASERTFERWRQRDANTWRHLDIGVAINHDVMITRWRHREKASRKDDDQTMIVSKGHWRCTPINGSVRSRLQLWRRTYIVLLLLLLLLLSLHHYIILYDSLLCPGLDVELHPHFHCHW